MLKVSNLSVAYGERVVLREVSLEVQRGSVVGLIGPNGAGKSTLIRAISGVIPVQAGKMYASDLDLTRLSYAERARLLAVVPQARSLPPAFTGREVVLLGRTPHLNWLGQISAADEDRVTQAMQRTDTLSLAERPVGELSGGEQQRLLIARALAQAAPILLMDEPTAHLDLQYQVSLLGLVRDLAHSDGLSILLALHDLNLIARYTDHVVVLVKGQIQSSGPTGEVLEAGMLSQVYQVPLQAVWVGKGLPPVFIPGD